MRMAQLPAAQKQSMARICCLVAAVNDAAATRCSSTNAVAGACAAARCQLRTTGLPFLPPRHVFASRAAAAIPLPYYLPLTFFLHSPWLW